MFSVVRIWILYSALLVASGWILSAFNCLNPAGYGVVFALTAAACIVWQRRTNWRPVTDLSQSFRKLCHRFLRAAPLLFLALAVLTLLAGALYPPLNGSTVQYRVPRVMHWLTAGHWYWIRIFDARNNIAGCGFEWLFPPLILLTHGDRCLYLLNWISFLLLPGLIFSVFTRLGVRPRVAWWWMWILPSGWCFVLQAGSTVDDCVAAAYALAAVDFALRARATRNVASLWLAMMAAALATGVKQTDIPLALPGLIAMWPARRLLFMRPVSSAAIAIFCLLISALPMIILDLRHTGQWAGMRHNMWESLEMTSPFWGVIGNVFCLTVQNLKPPVFPFVNGWDAAMINFLQTPFGAHFRQFERFGHLTFGTGEDAAALGTGIALLIFVSVVAGRRFQWTIGAVAVNQRPDMTVELLRWTPWGMLLVFMAKDGTYENARHFASYYFFLFPSLLTGYGQSALVRRRWWRGFALLVITVGVMVVVVSRDRPLFPAQTIIARLNTQYPGSKFISHVALTYSQTPDFARQRTFLSKNLPRGEPVLGYATTDGQLSSSLWLPYGKRRVQDILPGDPPDALREAGIHYLVLERAMLEKTDDTLQGWLVRYDGTVVTNWQYVADPYEPTEQFYLIHLRDR